MTALEKLLIAQHPHLNTNFFAGLFKKPSFRRSEKETMKRVQPTLESINAGARKFVGPQRQNPGTSQRQLGDRSGQIITLIGVNDAARGMTIFLVEKTATRSGRSTDLAYVLENEVL